MAYAMSVNNKNVFLAIKEVVLAGNQLGGIPLVEGVKGEDKTLWYPYKWHLKIKNDIRLNLYIRKPNLNHETIIIHMADDHLADLLLPKARKFSRTIECYQRKKLEAG